MKKLVYGVLTSAILLSNANSHEIWIEKDKKNEANIFFGEFADGQKEGDKFLDKLKVDTQKSLDEIYNNYNALMQKAFKGELFGGE